MTSERTELSGMTEGLRNFAAQYGIAISDPDLVRRYRMVEDGKRDVATKISAAEKRGEERGEKRGRAEMAALMHFLWSNGRGAYAMRASADEACCDKLLAEYGAAATQQSAAQ